MASSSTPLLARQKKDDHPIFLRVCHSPWLTISQKCLVILRSLLAAYMLAAFILIMNFEIKHNKHGWLIPFELSNVSYLMQTIYATITATWAFMHLYHSHPSENTSLQRLLSPPKQLADGHNRLAFSIFYQAVNAFPHVVTMVYWLILIPHRHTPVGEIFDHGRYRTFVILNLFGVNSLISLVEIMFLCSIRRPTPLMTHNAGLIFLSNTYMAYQYFGRLVNGRHVYYFLDPEIVGGEQVAFSIASFSALVIIFFSFNYGLTGLRETLAKKGEDNDSYARLP